MKGLERELGEGDDLRAGARGGLDRGEPAPDVGVLVGRRVLLHECDLHQSVSCP
jgi:hypothetical protein